MYLSKWNAWIGYRWAVAKSDWLSRDKVVQVVHYLKEYMAYQCLVEEN